MKGALLSVTCLLFLAYVSFAVLLYVSQEKLLYFPTREVLVSPRQIGLDFEEISLTALDGTRLSSWFVSADNSAGVILFCHGNAGNISHRLDSLEIFNRLGFSVFIFDYRGYGASEGHPTEEGTYQDVEAAWEYLVQGRGLSPSQITVFGRSFGGAVAAWIAARKSPRALILESSFTSVPDLAATLYPLFPVRFLSRFRYDTQKQLADIRCPVLIVHSPQDEIVPFSLGKALYGSVSGPKKFLEISGDHNSGFLGSQEMYSKGLADFLSGS